MLCYENHTALSGPIASPSDLQITARVDFRVQVIKDYQLYIVVGVLLSIDIAIMTTWQIIDPFYRETKQLGQYVSNNSMYVSNSGYLLYVCITYISSFIRSNQTPSIPGL